MVGSCHIEHGYHHHNSIQTPEKVDYLFSTHHHKKIDLNTTYHRPTVPSIVAAQGLTCPIPLETARKSYKVPRTTSPDCLALYYAAVSFRLPFDLPIDVNVCPDLDALIWLHLVQRNVGCTDVCTFFMSAIRQPSEPTLTLLIDHLTRIIASTDVVTLRM